MKRLENYQGLLKMQSEEEKQLIESIQATCNNTFFGLIILILQTLSLLLIFAFLYLLTINLK